MSNHFIYLRGLRLAEHTVFCVADGQKTYRDPRFGRPQPYSSGQQVKRSLLTTLTGVMGIDEAPITFNFKIDESKGKKSVKNEEPWNPCDPNYPDQLLGGWMRAVKGEGVAKRRSPLSISAMRPLHPLLAGVDKESVVFDRSANAAKHKVVIHHKGKEITVDEAKELVGEEMRDLSPRTYIPDGITTASGLFVYDIAIDLRRLFCVSNAKIEPELKDKNDQKEDMREQLLSAGWKESKNAFGPTLVCPKEKREAVIPALAKAMLQWKISSNQARTFSAMPLVAAAVSQNADQTAYAIRARLLEDVGFEKAVPVIDQNTAAELFVTPLAEQEIAGLTGASDALQKAEQKLIELMRAYQYE